MFKILKAFRNDENGAVTVDWVVLTAAVVGLGFAVLSSVSGGATSMASNVATALSGTNVSTGSTGSTTTTESTTTTN